MPERNRSYEALLLRAKDSPAGDRIVSMLTADDGILDAFVFGGARSSLRASASPFVFAKVFLYADPVKRYRKLTDLTIIESFPRLRDSYAKLWSASVIAELIVRTSGCGGEYAETLDLSLQALRVMDAIEDAPAGAPRGPGRVAGAEAGADSADRAVDLTLLAYLWKILDIMGLRPDLERCARCGAPLVPKGGRATGGAGAQYSAEQEGFVCDSCGTEGLPLGVSELECLRAFSRENLRDCAALEADDAALSSLKGIVYYLAQKAAEGTLLALKTE